jgi:hypothetical protein
VALFNFTGRKRRRSLRTRPGRRIYYNFGNKLKG